MRSVHTLPALLLALLAGCAEQRDSRYPSLLPRPIESRSDAEQVAAPVVPAAPDATLDARLSGIAATLDATARDFAPAASRADRAATSAKGAAVGSEKWIAAQTALAELDGYRASASSAVTELDQIAIERGAAGQPDYPALPPLHARAQELLDETTARIGTIQAALPQG